jgi:hypothetical protein
MRYTVKKYVSIFDISMKAFIFMQLVQVIGTFEKDMIEQIVLIHEQHFIIKNHKSSPLRKVHF